MLNPLTSLWGKATLTLSHDASGFPWFALFPINLSRAATKSVQRRGFASRSRSPPKPVVRDQIDRLAETNFPSCQPPPAQSHPHSNRRWKTGRNQQLNIKATGETIDRF